MDSTVGLFGAKHRYCSGSLRIIEDSNLNSSKNAPLTKSGEGKRGLSRGIPRTTSPRGRLLSWIRPSRQPSLSKRVGRLRNSPTSDRRRGRSLGTAYRGSDLKAFKPAAPSRASRTTAVTKRRVAILMILRRPWPPITTSAATAQRASRAPTPTKKGEVVRRQFGGQNLGQVAPLGEENDDEHCAGITIWAPH